MDHGQLRMVADKLPWVFSECSTVVFWVARGKTVTLPEPSIAWRTTR